MKSIPKAILIGALLVLTVPAFAEETHHTNPDSTVSQPPSASGMQPGMGMMPGGMMPGGMMPGGMMPGGMMSGGMMSGGMMPMMESANEMMAPRHIEGRIAFLKAELKITADQESSWQAFAESVRSDARTMQDMAKRMQGMMVPGSLIERLDRHESMLDAHLDQLRRIEAALRPLYESLNGDQRRSMDELFMPVVMGMMM
ncbi:MAG TPA: Spy/CpxP family protein refolding chaperone [Dongiaceae bacterium]